jgi:hypothetical protein
VDNDCLIVSVGGEDVAKRHKEARIGLGIMAFLGLILVCEAVYIFLQVKV